MNACALVSGFLNLFAPAAKHISPGYPTNDSIDQWMVNQIAYYQREYPDSLWKLFCPSCGDYIPLVVHARISQNAMQEHMPRYLELKNKHQEAAKKALQEVVEYSIYRGGPKEDYPC